MNRRHLYLLSAALVIIGMSVAIYKHRVLGYPLRPDYSASLWTIEAHLTFERHTVGPVKARLKLPSNPPGFRILREDFVSRGYGLTTETEDGSRVAMWAVRRANGEQSLYYRATVFKDRAAGELPPQPPFPDVPELEPPYDEALDALLDTVRSESADVETFVSAMLNRLSNADTDTNAQLLNTMAQNDFDRAQIAVSLLAGARIPARVIQVIPLLNSPHTVNPEPWLAIHNGTEWLFFDPVTGASGLESNLLVWSWDTDPFFEVDGGIGEALEIAVTARTEDALSLAEQRAHARGSVAAQYSLFQLPIPTQGVYEVLLMVPIGAIVIVFMRNFVGVRTFGTFLPVLVALAFRETNLLAGVVLFTLLVSAGLAVRFYLDRLHLLLVPRLAAILTVVVLLMLFFSLLFHRLGIDTGLSVALFPMVIMTMVIERMSIVWDERGPADAIRDGLGTLAVASLAYVMMGINLIEHLVFVFPELLLPLLAAFLLSGRYTGYRLSELTRFRVLGQTKD